MTQYETMLVPAMQLIKNCVETWLGGCDEAEFADLVALLEALDLLKTATVQRILDWRESSTAQVQSNHARYDSALFAANVNEDMAYPGFIDQEPQYCDGTNSLEHSHVARFDSATNCQASGPPMRGQIHERGCHSYVDDPAFRHYLDIACYSDFRLPHDPLGCLNRTQVAQLLQPLIEEKPLSVQLIHGLLHSLLPGPLHILELKSENCAQNLLACTGSAESFAAIIVQERDTPPLLVLGDGTTRTIFVIAGETERPPFSASAESSLGSWQEICIDISHPLCSTRFH
ncbi:hypothetical protein PMIN02_010806 [Paraphaeosphaeria minitans]